MAGNKIRFTNYIDIPNFLQENLDGENPPNILAEFPLYEIEAYHEYGVVSSLGIDYDFKEYSDPAQRVYEMVAENFICDQDALGLSPESEHVNAVASIAVSGFRRTEAIKQKLNLTSAKFTDCKSIITSINGDKMHIVLEVVYE